MARCGCGSDTCNCNFIAGNNVGITGNGTRSNPYVVEAIVPDTAPGTPTSGTGDGTRFVGEITIHSGLSNPAGWLLCNGAQVNRTVYSDLFAVIGVGYGAGNGSTTFTLPNFTDRIPFGSGPLHPRGALNGSRIYPLTPANLPLHYHEMGHDHGADTTAMADVHVHGFDHGHPNSTSSTNGNHKHSLDYSQNAGTGTTGATVPLGLAFLDRTSDAAVALAGNHAHTTNTPNFVGNTAPGGSHNHVFDVSPYNGATGPGGTASVNPVIIDPPNQGINYVIKY